MAQHENLRHAIAAREIDQRLGHIVALENPGFDLQTAREVQLPIERVALLG